MGLHREPLRDRPARAAALARRVAALATAVALVACSSGGPVVGGGELPQHVPDGFPIPAGAQIVHDGTAASLALSGRTVDEVEAFYREDLPAAGWTIVDDFEGVDPRGAATRGFIVQRGDEEGVVALSESEDAVVLRINFTHPSPSPAPAG